jgi:hypothetical protein
MTVSLYLDGGFLGDSVTVQDNARFVFRQGRLECVRGSCGDVPGLLPVLIAEENAVLEIYDNVNTWIAMSGNSVAEVYGRGLRVLNESESFGATNILIGSMILEDGSRDLSIALRLRDNASFVLREIPEPRCITLCSIILLLITIYRQRYTAVQVIQRYESACRT